MTNQINRRSGNDRRTSQTTASFPLRDRQGISVTQDRRTNCDRRIDGLELTELNLSQKVFRTAFEKFQKLERKNVLRYFTPTRLIHPVFALCLLSVTSISYAADSEGTIPRIITAPAEPLALEVVLLCPEGSQHEGELLPKWVTNDEATDYFCNDSTEEMELSE